MNERISAINIDEILSEIENDSSLTFASLFYPLWSAIDSVADIIMDIVIKETMQTYKRKILRALFEGLNAKYKKENDIHHPKDLFYDQRENYIQQIASEKQRQVVTSIEKMQIKMQKEEVKIIQQFEQHTTSLTKKYLTLLKKQTKSIQLQIDEEKKES